MVEVLVMKSSAGNEELQSFKETVENMLYTYDLMRNKEQFVEVLADCRELQDLITASNQQLLRELEGQKLESLSWKLKYIQMKIKRQRALEYEALPSDKLTALLQQKYRIERQIEALRGTNDEH